MTKRRSIAALLLVLAVLAWFGLDALSDRVGASFNKTRDPGPYTVTGSALELHKSLLVGDLHADSLLWNRNLQKRGSYGHVDLPRLREGGVALQVFGLVTKTPAGMNFEKNSDETDRITALAIAQRWPPWTWTSLYRRALHQCRRLERLASRSGGRVVLVRTRADLAEVVRRRQAGDDVLGALLGLEGAHALEGDLEKLRGLHKAGLRMIGLAHFFDNQAAGSAHGARKGGLSDLGRQVVAEAEHLGIAIDLAHASPKAFDEVIRQATKPVVVSHTGVRATCDGTRNLSDRQLRAVAATGGVVGIGLFPGAVCGPGIDATIRAIEHAVRVVGPGHVALGSDFDGATTTPIDASGLVLITERLLRRGIPSQDVAQIMGRNMVRVLGQTLPES